MSGPFLFQNEMITHFSFLVNSMCNCKPRVVGDCLIYIFMHVELYLSHSCSY